MKKYFILTNVIFFISTLLLGELLLAVLKLTTGIYSVPQKLNNVYENTKIYLLILIIGVLSYLIYLFYRLLIKLIISKRYDLLLTIFLTVCLYCYINLDDRYIFSALYDLILNNLILSFISVIAAGVSIPMIINYLDFARESNSKSVKLAPSLLIDEPLDGDGEDLFGYRELARNFSNMVLQNYSERSSLVFGIEAPWGTGKTTFLNMCNNEWINSSSDPPIILAFDPWHFDSTTELVSKFLDEFRKAINKKYYLPEISKFFQAYLKIIQSVKVEPFLINLPDNESNLTKSHEEIINVLKLFPLKIVVIIDDIDRSPYAISKQIFRLVSICANFPKVNYILCYDPDNLTSTDSHAMNSKLAGDVKSNGSIYNLMLKHTHNIDTYSIQQYLEKIINIKFVLPYYKKESLLNYFVEEVFELVKPKNEKEQASFDDRRPEELMVLKQKIRTGIERIFNEVPYVTRKYINTVRQVKNILNTFMSIRLEDRDLSSYDIEKFEYVILLILLKFHYPKVYSDICYYEFDRKLGLFIEPKYHFTYWEGYLPSSDPTKHDYKNYFEANNYGEELSSILAILFDDLNPKITNEQFLQYLMYIEGIRIDHITNSIFLEFFLWMEDRIWQVDLIDELNAYIDEKFKIDQALVVDLIKRNKLVYEFYRMINTKLHDINKINTDYSIRLLDNVLEKMPDYSHYPSFRDSSNSIVNIRFYLNLTLAKLLDDGIWNENGAGVNSIENIKIISKYILGDGQIESILSRLADSRGVLGIYDMVITHDFCVDQEMFDISRSLAWHSITENGNIDINEQRINDRTIGDTIEEISQKTFEVFNKEFVETKRNFFAEIEQLCLSDCLGKEVRSVPEWLSAISEEPDCSVKFEKLKSRIEGFVINTLCIDDISYKHCGVFFFDGTKIKDRMQDYLFEFCFSVTNDEKSGFKYFVNFILKQYVTVTSGTSMSYILNLQNIYKILDKNRLSRYWQKHREQIKEYFEGREGYVWTSGYTASYSEDLTNDKGTGMFDIFDRELM